MHEDDPVRAIRAAVEMLERLDQLNRSFQQRHGITLAIRIGINTGEAFAWSAELAISSSPVMQ